MKSNEYLYGTDVEVPEVPAYIAMRRISLLEDNLEELLKVNYMERDSKRVAKVQKAIDFWRKLGENKFSS